jgi:hypothetical protein
METLFQTSRKNKYAKPIFMIWSALMIGLFILTLIDKSHSLMNSLFGGLVVIIILGIVLSCYFFNNYKITNDTLVIVFGLLKWTIKINEIDFIRLNQKRTGGKNTASMSLKGIVIYYNNKRSSIYISPLQQDNFIDMLKKINTEIEIIDGLTKTSA